MIEIGPNDQRGPSRILNDLFEWTISQNKQKIGMQLYFDTFPLVEVHLFSRIKISYIL